MYSSIRTEVVTGAVSEVCYVVARQQRHTGTQQCGQQEYKARGDHCY